MIIKFGITLPNGIEFKDTLAYRCLEKVKLENNGKYDLKEVVLTGAGVGRNRNKCVNNGKSTLINQKEFDFDFIQFVDFDVEFSFKDVDQLVSHNKDIVSGSYHYKKNKNQIHAGFWGRAPGLRGDNLTVNKQGLVKVDRCGGGFLLIKREVFIKLDYPWFSHRMVEVEIEGQKHREETSEDFGFCMLAQEGGFDIFCDTDCQLKHDDHILSGSTAAPSMPVGVAKNLLEYINRADLKGSEVKNWVEAHNYLNNIVNNVNG
jgi:hypothetical protein